VWIFSTYESGETIELIKVLCIIPCGNRKIWDKNPNAGPTRAKDVYIGPFAKKCKEYAEKFYLSSWCILSAKYGFLFPDDIVPGSYNVTLMIKEQTQYLWRNCLNRSRKRV